MRGRSIPISRGRRFVIDLMQLSRGVPIVSALRHMQLGRLVEARAWCAARPMWISIFTKAYGLLSCEFPEFRRSYIKLPWPRLYEYPEPVAMLPVEVEHDGEVFLFPLRIKDPGHWPLGEIDRIILETKKMGGRNDTKSRGLFAISSLPFPLRRPLQRLVLNVGRQRANFFGTFAVGGMSERGTESPYVISPLSNFFSYGVIARDGQVDFMQFWDHRVMDGGVVAQALGRMEHILNETIADELLVKAV
jgi:hypothetical protein